MEQEKPVSEDIKSEQKNISHFISKFTSVLLTIITSCVMLMVAFIWNLKADFATERQMMVQVLQVIKEIKDDARDDKRNIQTLNETLIRQDQRINALEEKTNRLLK